MNSEFVIGVDVGTGPRALVDRGHDRPTFVAVDEEIGEHHEHHEAHAHGDHVLGRGEPELRVQTRN